MEGQAVKLAPWGSLQCLQAQEQGFDLIVGQQDPFLPAFLRGEHHGATRYLRGLIAPQINAIGQEVGFDGAEHGLVSVGLD